AHAKAFREEGLAERHALAAAFGERLVLLLGLGQVGDGQRQSYSLRRAKMSGRRIGSHQDLAVDRHPRMHDLLLEAGLGLHVRRALVGAHHEFDFAAEHLLVIFERGLAVAVVEQIRIKHRSLLGLKGWWMVAYASEAAFNLARPASKS